MSLKQTLLTLSLGGVAVGSEAPLNPNTPSETYPAADQQLQTWIQNNTDMISREDAVYTARCKALRESLAQVKYPTKNDRDTMLRAFDMWTTSEDAKKVIYGMRKNVKFEPKIQKNVSYYACYNDFFKHIKFGELFTDYKSAEQETKTAKYIDTLSHECYHSYQAQNKLLDPKGLSPEQYLTQTKLYEAEAKTMGQLNAEIQRYNLYDPKNADDFLSKSLSPFTLSGMPTTPTAAEMLQTHLKEELILFWANPNNTMSDFPDDIKEWQQLLFRAQKAAAGDMMKEYVGHDSPHKEWHEAYDKQGLGSLQIDAKEGYVSTIGNPEMYNYLLDYYKENYGLKRKDIDHSGGLASEHHRSLFKKAVQQLTKQGYLEQGDKNLIAAYDAYDTFSPEFPSLSLVELTKSFEKFKDYIPNHGPIATKLLNSINPAAREALIKWTQKRDLIYNIQDIIPFSTQEYQVLKAAGYNPAQKDRTGQIGLISMLNILQPTETTIPLACAMLKDAVKNMPDNETRNEIAAFFKYNFMWTEPLKEWYSAEIELKQKLKAAQTPQVAQIIAQQYLPKLGHETTSQLLLESPNPQAHAALKSMVSDKKISFDLQYTIPQTPEQYTTLKQMGFNPNDKEAYGLNALNTLVLSQNPTQDNVKTACTMLNDYSADIAQSFCDNLKAHPGWENAIRIYLNAKQSEEKMTPPQTKTQPHTQNHFSADKSHRSETKNNLPNNEFTTNHIINMKSSSR